MTISFEVVIDSQDYSVDMNSGLETLKGASEVTRKIATTLLDEHVPKKLTTENKVRTRLKKTFQGSYGQIYSLSLESEDLKKKFRKIGKQSFSELMAYFINEALYKESAVLSDKATKILGKLGEKLENELVEELRVSSLSHLHSISNHFNKEVQVRYRKNRDEKRVLANINRESFATLMPVTDKKKIDIIASITRLNINTGNGRLLIQGENETVAFGFPARYKDVKRVAKKKFSSNLDKNNGTPEDQWETLTLKAHTQKTKTGRIIKYLIEGIY